MKFLKHKDSEDVVFQRVNKTTFKSGTSEYWTGYWWTIGTTALYRTTLDDFFVKQKDVPKWEDYTPPPGLRLEP